MAFPTPEELAQTIVPAYGCAACEDQILSRLSRQITESYRQVVAIKAYTKQFANLGDIVLAETVRQVLVLVNVIPPPVPITFLNIATFLTCPLLPLAIEAEDIAAITALTSKDQLDRIRQLYVPWVSEMKANYERALKQLAVWDTVRLFKTFLDAIKRFRMSAWRFADDLLVATTVQVVCPDAYKDSIFEAFVDATTDFSVTGIAPSGLKGHANDLVQALGEAQVKLTGWSIVAAGGTLPVSP